ncbi:MAG: hypothetical protein GY822_30420 [Deltaproteobacteria bacterium]|nr:hypothetical protein [Deltaproteobacteria bacterium]
MSIKVSKKQQFAYRKDIVTAISEKANGDGLVTAKNAQELAKSNPNIGTAAQDFFQATGDSSVPADRLANSIGSQVDRAIESATEGREVNARKMPGHLAGILLRTTRNHMPIAQLENIAKAFATNDFAKHTDFQNPTVDCITDNSATFDEGYLYEGADSYGSGRQKGTRKAEDVQAFQIDLGFDHESEAGETRTVDFTLLMDRRNGDLIEVNYGRGVRSSPESYQND